MKAIGAGATRASRGPPAPGRAAARAFSIMPVDSIVRPQQPASTTVELDAGRLEQPHQRLADVRLLVLMKQSANSDRVGDRAAAPRNRAA